MVVDGKVSKGGIIGIIGGGHNRHNRLIRHDGWWVAGGMMGIMRVGIIGILGSLGMMGGRGWWAWCVGLVGLLAPTVGRVWAVGQK